jgi:hypothetical protein|tara:strand:+ start:167 stop:379 length:213 start_codon:yes stop_codon:yes gene_type:complete
MNDLHAHDPGSWIECIWDALSGYREDCIPESDSTYNEEWDDICTAMAWITEEFNLDYNSNGELVLQKGDT